ERVAILFGGRISEELIFDEITTGAGNDLETATDLARKMVCEWGMSAALGPLTYGKKEEAIFIGREIAQHQDYSEETAKTIDAEVKRIMLEQYSRGKELIENHLDSLKRVADSLIEYETIDGDDIQTLLDGNELTREPPKVRMPTREEVDRKRLEKRKKKKKKEAVPVLGPLAGAGEVKAIRTLFGLASRSHFRQTRKNGSWPSAVMKGSWPSTLEEPRPSSLSPTP
ncbi:MAG: hypothetical protein V3T05_13965, partial [Myxococcota bacterium]